MLLSARKSVQRDGISRTMSNNDKERNMTDNILDGCFAGCFRWMSSRGFAPVGLLRAI
jgi:hypothetical protein